MTCLISKSRSIISPFKPVALDTMTYGGSVPVQRGVGEMTRMADRVGEFITVTQWHYKVRNRGRVEGYPAIDGEGREEGPDHKRTVGKTTLILQVSWTW